MDDRALVATVSLLDGVLGRSFGCTSSAVVQSIPLLENTDPAIRAYVHTAIGKSYRADA